MSESSGPTRRTTPRKVKNQDIRVIPIKIESENNEVSSTSPDKMIEMRNGNGSGFVAKIESNCDDNLDMELHLKQKIKAEVDHDDAEEEEEAIKVSDEDCMDEFTIPERTLPAYNVPERIVIVYDSAIDEVSTGFNINGETICPNAMLKRSIRFFLYNKHLIDARHEYALVVINDNSVVWLKDFTNHIDTIINALEDIPSCEPEDILVLDNLFRLIHDKVALPDVKGNFNVPPPYIVRVLFTYGRSFTLPKVDDTAKALATASPYFTFDILMTHEMPSATNNCIKIFKYLQLIDCKGFAYFFPVGRSTSQLHLSMAKLLSHPFQRPLQRAANYAINMDV